MKKLAITAMLLAVPFAALFSQPKADDPVILVVNGVEVPYCIKRRRAGDIATCYCDPSKAKAELGWEARYGIEEMVRDSWNWQRSNPDGYV